MELEALTRLIDQLALLHDSVGQAIIALTAAEMALKALAALAG